MRSRISSGSMRNDRSRSRLFELRQTLLQLVLLLLRFGFEVADVGAADRRRLAAAEEAGGAFGSGGFVLKLVELGDRLGSGGMSSGNGGGSDPR